MPWNDNGKSLFVFARSIDRISVLLPVLQHLQRRIPPVRHDPRLVRR